jgi:hypothetical protein
MLGARTLGSFRSALQAQCKGLLDASHARAMNQLQHLLESEQWVAVEVPGSFQAIVDRLIARCGEGAALLDGRQLPAPAAAQGSTPAADAADDGSSEARSATLQLCGKSFHLVNSGLMLLKMLDEYMSLYELMPQFGAEIVHRELELLKLFNSQTAALVLGAGAMRTAGLRSISAKQLALSCQAVGMLATLLPLLRAGSLGLVSQPRRALLMPEFDRLLQDLTMHMDEVHSKLVDIMRDRLSAAVQTLPGEVRQLAANPALAPPDRPSHTIALLVKQLGTLRAVLAPYLLKEEVEFIFGAVARAYSDALSETFEGLLAQDGSCEGGVKANALAMLQVGLCTCRRSHMGVAVEWMWIWRGLCCSGVGGQRLGWCQVRTMLQVGLCRCRCGHMCVAVCWIVDVLWLGHAVVGSVGSSRAGSQSRAGTAATATACIEASCVGCLQHTSGSGKASHAAEATSA